MRDQDHTTLHTAEIPDELDLGAAFVAIAPGLRRYALRLGVSPTDADDIVSEAFARLLAKAREGRLPETNLRGYLMRAIKNLTVDTWRAQARTQPSDDEHLLDREVHTEDPVVAALDRSAARAALLNLPTRVQRALWLSDVEGRSASDVASSLGVSTVNARALVSRGRRQLRCGYLEALFPPRHQEAVFGSLHASLAATAVGAAGQRQSRSAMQHIDECSECASTYLEMQSEAGKMRARAVTLLLLSALATSDWDRLEKVLRKGPPVGVLPPVGGRHRLWVALVTAALVIGLVWVSVRFAREGASSPAEEIQQAAVTLALPQRAVPAGSTELTITMRNTSDKDKALVLDLDPLTFASDGHLVTVSVANADGEQLLSATDTASLLADPPVLTILGPHEGITLIATIDAR